MAAPAGLKYAPTHEWVQAEGDTALVGISQHAAEELGDVALVLFPEVGRMVQAEEKFGEVESIKAVSDLYSPVSGEVIAVNDALNDSPQTVNDDPYGAGWMIKVKLTQPADLDALLDESAYDALIHA